MSQREVVFVCLIGLVACAFIFAGAILGPKLLGRHAHKVLAGYTVKIQFEGGHGSGVHIGDGLILTAAHVVKDAKSFEIKTDRGEMLFDGEILWTSPLYDLALLRTDSSGRLTAARLTCRASLHHEPIRAQGNPYEEEFMTVWGYADGKSPNLEVKETARASMFFMPGMSGGPVLSERDELLGIVSMGGRAPVGLFVPSMTVCKLLAK